MEQPGTSAEEVKTRSIQSGKKPFFGKKFLVFLVSLLLSGAMWIYIELMKDYTTDLQYSLNFMNVPEDLILVNRNDSTIKVGVTAQGFELLEALYFRKNKVFEIDLSELRIRQANGMFTAYLPSSQLIRQIDRQLGANNTVSYVKPDTLFFRFAQVTRMKVPVIPDLEFNFSQQYLLYDSVSCMPQDITVTSIKEVTDTLRRLYTEKVVITDRDSSIVLNVPVKRTMAPALLRFSSDSVKITVPVRKFTEAVFDIPVTMEGNFPVKLFPDKVQVTCMVPMQHFKEISESGFKAVVVTDNIRKGDIRNLQVELKEIPRHVKVTRIKPEQVEFIILSK